MFRPRQISYRFPSIIFFKSTLSSLSSLNKNNLFLLWSYNKHTCGYRIKIKIRMLYKSLLWCFIAKFSQLQKTWNGGSRTTKRYDFHRPWFFKFLQLVIESWWFLWVVSWQSRQDRRRRKKNSNTPSYTTTSRCSFLLIWPISQPSGFVSDTDCPRNCPRSRVVIEFSVGDILSRKSPRLQWRWIRCYDNRGDRTYG